MIAREPIYAALFVQLTGAADFATTGRRLRHWNELTPAEQPALFMRQKSETGSVPVLGAPTVWALSVEVHLYAHCSDPYAAPAAVLNPLLDAVDAALAPLPATGVQNLGLPALVQHAYIAGKVTIDEGTMRDQIAATIPHRHSLYRIGAGWMKETDAAGDAAPSDGLAQLVDAWWSDHFPGSPVAQVTQAWNHAFAAKEELKRRLVALMQGGR